jgi:hypothetical protein
MKKILLILTLCSAKLFAQGPTDCPFAQKKYVHYDGVIESSNNYLPTQYQQLIQNKPNYDRVNDHLGSTEKATCFYKTSIHNHDSIKKPFVFVEGVSFEKKSIADNEYNMGDYFSQDWLPSPPVFEFECVAAFNSSPQHHGSFVGYSTFNWATLVTGVDAEGHHANDPLRIEKAPQLLNQLCCAGYDICFVDFHSGEAYIESNGEALYSILVQLHQKLVENNSSEKMVVCGASMGGLVARYAINKLEAEGHTDWVEKFISFDSPQMGANIPLGVQYTLKHLKGLGSDLEEKYNKLTCPSASQLVNYSCLETNLLLPTTFTTPSPSIERTELLSNPYMGWPQHCTKIAISNGSRLGTTQSSTHQPGDKVLDIDGLLNLDIFSLPQNNNNYQKVFDFDPPYCLAAFLSTMGPVGITQQSVRVKNTMALDLAPGSFRTDLKDLESELPNIITNAVGQVIGACNLGWLDNSENNDKLCFIPLMSSIGAKQYEHILKNNNIVTQGFIDLTFNGNSKFVDLNHERTYFDIVYAPTENQSHVQITDENIAWVMHELTGMPESITHENRLLASNTFRAQNYIRAGNNILNNPICDQNINYTGGGPLYPINGSIDAMMQSMHCGDVAVLSNQAVFYKAGNYISLEPGFYTHDEAVFQAEIINIPFCYSSERVSPPTGTDDGMSSAYNNDFESKKNMQTKEQTASLGKNILLFPNPSNTFCDINSNETIEEITLYSVMGTVINSTRVNQNNYRLTTDHLTNGVYLINIKTANENVTKKVIVKHE